MASSEVAEHPKHGSPEHDVPHDKQEQLCDTEQSDSVKEPGDAHQSDQLQESTSEAKLGDNGDSAMDHSHTDSARPSLPKYCYTGIPELMSTASKDFSHPKDNFLRGAKWSPDGSCILSCSNDNKLRLFNLPQSVLQPRDSEQTSVGSPEMGDDDSGHPNQMNHALLMFSNCSHYFSGRSNWQTTFDTDLIGWVNSINRSVAPARTLKHLNFCFSVLASNLLSWGQEAVVTVEEGEIVYDFQWFPRMSSLDAATCCFVSVCRDHPVHLWDAYTGALRASYTAYNHLDEVTAPLSVAFHPHGSKMYCGFHNCIRIFDVTRAGRQSETRSTFNKKTISLQGIVSCIAFNPAFPDMYALGSYSKSIGLYSEMGGQLALFSGTAGGVTQLMFSPDGNYLFSGCRKDSDILCWDMRNPGSVLFCFSRTADTNQRMYFDLDRTGAYLVSGHQTGAVSVWDVAEAAGEDSTVGSGGGDGRGCATDDLCGNAQQVAALVSFLAHQDCVNSISLHPTLPILATGSGQRKFPLPRLCLDAGSEDSSESESGNEDYPENCDNSLKLWVFQQGVAYPAHDSAQCTEFEDV